METSRNRAPFIEKFWKATSYGMEGFKNREPYCAAAGCYWVWQWLQDPDVLDAFKFTAAQAEAWRCKSARAFDWTDWAKKRKLLVMTDSLSNVLHTADIMIFDMSHWGLVYDDKGTRVYNIEANTGAKGERDGEGVFTKDRPREIARDFIRLLA